MLSSLEKPFRVRKDLLVIVAIFLFSLLSMFIHPFWITGDTPTYVKSVEFLKGNFRGNGFLPFRIISTYLALNILIFLEKIFGNLFLGWTFMNLAFYITAGYFIYKIVHEIYGDYFVAFVAALLYIGNYVIVIHGLAFALDLGGWAFYLASSFFSVRYLKSGDRRYIYASAVVVAMGSLLKEYALGGYPVLMGVIIYRNYDNWREMVRLAIPTTLISFLPVALLHLYVYVQFHYSYLDWYTEQRYQYGGSYYKSHIIEYIKSFGAMYGVGWFLFFGSIFYLVKDKFKYIDRKYLVFSLILFLSFTPLWFWPGIVPRTVFVSAPFLITVSSYFVNRYKFYWYLFIPFLFVYILWSFLLDRYIFDFMNIDIVLKYVLFWLY